MQKDSEIKRKPRTAFSRDQGWMFCHVFGGVVKMKEKDSL